MLEKRKHKRLKMEHALELARLNADGTADDGVVNADILNISRGGIGFLSRKRLEVGSYYDTRISPVSYTHLCSTLTSANGGSALKPAGIKKLDVLRLLC